MTEIIPSILTNDISDFRKKYAELFGLRQHFSKLHVDFADGEFVPNKTLMPNELVFLNNSTLFLIAHFMSLDPKKYFQAAKKAGFKEVLFHFEALPDPKEIDETIDAANNLWLKPGIALNPETPLYKLGKFIHKVQHIQIMSIHPGAQGRDFMPETLEKIRELRSLSKNVIISVDGGIKVGIAKQCALAGADRLVAGSTILRSENEEHAIEALIEDVK